MFQSYTLMILHSSNHTLFQLYTLPIIHSSNLTFFQSSTIPIFHSSNLSLFPLQIYGYCSYSRTYIIYIPLLSGAHINVVISSRNVRTIQVKKRGEQPPEEQPLEEQQPEEQPPEEQPPEDLRT